MTVEVEKFVKLYYGKNIVGETKVNTIEPLKVVYDEDAMKYYVLSNCDRLKGAHCSHELKGGFRNSWVLADDSCVRQLLGRFNSIVVLQPVLRRV